MKFKTAKNYEDFAYAQKFAAKKLINELKKHSLYYKNIYEIGCGCGVLTKFILKELDFKDIILNDIYKSDFMNGNFSTQIGDIRDIKMPSNLDLIVSSSVFQWFDKRGEFEKLIDKIYLSLNSGGIFAFCMFINGTLYELSSFTKQGLNYKTDKEILSLLSDFKILNFINDEYIAKFNNLKELLNHLKQTGVNNISGNFKLTKSSILALENHFENDFSLSYKFINVVCKKA
ncbi:methyltransferase domain-containing protein [Campylobacter sputorum]|uniref:methyltransferase domain-containing protein n=1 Tax=Campylobacter sputorum TaxID=206 RepID=UPI000B795CD5|nr:methyltransferase domain-containing protein [Campylobacter sputorum]ASM36454.1 malonyl-[acp] methyltransferase [Campylobacter sputorum bv. faecalis CCUG 20703]